MNYMKQVAEMLGVELGDKFNVRDWNDTYKLTETGLYCLENSSCAWKRSVMLEDILVMNAVIIKKPWKPRIGEKYYYVSKNGTVGSYVWNDCLFDNALYKIGNCFKTGCEITLGIIQKYVDFYNSDEQMNIGGSGNE